MPHGSSWAISRTIRMRRTPLKVFISGGLAACRLVSTREGFEELSMILRRLDGSSQRTVVGSDWSMD